jgi:hypothetical protein
MASELKGMTVGGPGRTDECDPLMLADYLAYGTFVMESAGVRAAPTEAQQAEARESARRVTGWTELTFTAEGLAELKSSLIAGLKRSGGWKATFLAPPSVPAGEAP